jgi:DNA repair protein RecN (Recombination protein N)
MGAINLFLKKKVPENTIRGEDCTLLVEAICSQGEEEFVLKREVSHKASRAYINNKVVPFPFLKERAEKLFNIYGQNEHTFLLKTSNHGLYLDEFCGNRPILERLSENFIRLKEARTQLEEMKVKGERAYEKIDFLNFRISEIEGLNLGPGDDVKLEQRLKILASAEEILSKSNAVLRDFYQQDNSIYNLIAEHKKDLDFLLEIYPQLGSLNEEVNRFYTLLHELSSSISDIINQVDYDEEELNRCEEQSLKLSMLKSKYNVSFGQLLTKLEEFKQERDNLVNMDFSIKDQQIKVEQGLKDYRRINLQLRESRRKRTGELSTLIEKELARLEMKQAQFLIQVEEKEPDLANITENGTDLLEFHFTSNPGQKPGRIKDIASGGELSRLMLVLKSILNTDIFTTYIFDEIDTGIGGKTAEFVGEKLRRISEDNQVICISHLPQIASFAETHHLITKEFRKGETYSYVKELSEAERLEEIGRLMAGSAVNGDVLKAAQGLLEKNRR